MSMSTAIRSITYATAAGERRRFRVVVIGAGQAGLAVARQLLVANVDVIVLEREARIGEPWRRRWDTLRLFTPAEFVGLPGLPFPGDKGAFPTKDEMATYLERYAREMHIPVRVNMKVDSLERTARGYVVAAGDQQLEADHVVVTTGPYQRPRTPQWARDLDRSIVQIQSSDYRNPAQLPDGDVLVVGAGNTGAELALEAAGAGHKVFLSGRDVGHIPRVLWVSNGRLFWFLATYDFTTGSPIGRRIGTSIRVGHSGPIVRIRKDDLARADIARVARVTGAYNGRVWKTDAPSTSRRSSGVQVSPWISAGFICRSSRPTAIRGTNAGACRRHQGCTSSGCRCSEASLRRRSWASAAMPRLSPTGSANHEHHDSR
jgi:putative flavoprotein involved in K+ transport